MLDMAAAPVVQNLQDIIASLNPAYAQSANLFQTQIQAIPGQTAAAQAALDATKTRSFSDINTNANSKGIAFSGIPSSEQARYLGEKYLPAVANLKTSANNQKLTLQQALASLYQDQYKTALGIQQTQQGQLYDWNKLQEQIAAQDRQAAASRSYSSSSNPDIQIVHNAQGGWTVLENGVKSKNYDLASAAAATGKDLISLLSQGDAKDRQAAKWFYDNSTQTSRTGGKSKDPAVSYAYALKQLQHDRPTAFYLGGTYGG